MKKTILLLSVLVALTAPALGGLWRQPVPAQKFLDTGIEKVAGDVSQEVPPGSGGAWLESAAEFFVAPVEYQSPTIGPKGDKTGQV